jgi:tRNA (guanine-N7-)-methyltransferase
MSQVTAAPPKPLLDYHATSFSQGRMDFAWEELSAEERRQAYADWNAGKGLIGGDPRWRPGSDRLPAWGRNQPFFRTLALDDPAADNGLRLRAALASDQPLEIEIGFGRGDFLLDRALRYPQRLLLGYETRTQATRLCLQRVERLALHSLWLSDDDARFSLPRILPDARIDAVYILFPDPWWKAQHKVKRLFSPPFVDLLAAKMRPGGLLLFKSDVQEYGELVRYLVEQQGAFLPHDPTLATQIGDYVPTHREFWCRQRGLQVYTYSFRRRLSP